MLHIPNIGSWMYDSSSDCSWPFGLSPTPQYFSYRNRFPGELVCWQGSSPCRSQYWNMSRQTLRRSALQNTGNPSITNGNPGKPRKTLAPVDSVSLIKYCYLESVHFLFRFSEHCSYLVLVTFSFGVSKCFRSEWIYSISFVLDVILITGSLDSNV